MTALTYSAPCTACGEGDHGRDHGAFTFWDDGFIVTRVTGGPLADDR